MNDAGMFLKTKDHCGKGGDETGMSMKTQEISVHYGNVVESKGS